jgi:hypothetical protein
MEHGDAPELRRKKAQKANNQISIQDFHLIIFFTPII